MNANLLKLIAIIGMVLDHVGWVLLPDVAIFHFIGRITFPIFCYFITEGFLKTRSRKNYLLRLLGIAVLSQLPFIMTFRLVFGEAFSGLNTIFNLAIGLMAIWIYDKVKFKGKFIIIIVGALLGLLLMTDGDVYGILMIFFFYKYHDDFKKMATSITWLTILYNVIFQIYPILATWLMGIMPIGDLVNVITQPSYYEQVFMGILMQLTGLLALPLIRFYNGEKGKNLKLVFYSFYPVHLIVLYVIKVWVIR